VPRQRRYIIIHERMLIEWLLKTYPPGTWRTNVRLGRPHPEQRARAVAPEELRAFYPWMPSADAVVVLPEEVHIVECLVRPEWWKAFQLVLYEEFFRITEEYREHWEKPVRLILLSAVTNPIVTKARRKIGVRVVTWRPPYVDEYLALYPYRKRRPAVQRVESPL